MSNAGDNRIAFYERMENMHLEEQESIIGNMDVLVSQLKEGAYLAHRIIRTDAKTINQIEETASKQEIQMKTEKDALRRYYLKAGPRTCYEYIIVCSILAITVVMILFIAMT